MLGTIVPAWSARVFSFSQLGAGATGLFPYVPVTDLLAYREAVFLVRVHDVTITGTASLHLRVLAAAPSCDEPGRPFLYPEEPLASVSVQGAERGDLLRAVLPDAFGAAVQVAFVPTQPTAAAETIEARLSGAFLVRR